MIIKKRCRLRELLLFQATCFRDFAVRTCVVALAATAVLLSGAWAGTSTFAEQAAPVLEAEKLVALADRGGSADPLPDAFEAMRELAFGGTGRMLAFEENKRFTYAAGTPDAGGTLVRRVIFLKPSTFVVYDLFSKPAEAGTVRWSLATSGKAELVRDSEVRVVEGEKRLLVRRLLPPQAEPETTTVSPAAEGRPGGQRVDMVVPRFSLGKRWLHLVRVTGTPEPNRQPGLMVKVTEGRLEVAVAAPTQRFRLSLPEDVVDAGSIEVADGDGQVALAERPFPSGVLPHTAEGLQLLERWDRAYRDNRRPAWDVGRPAGELKKAVEEGTLEPGRAVVLGCGTGTNAIYLARQGFDVTGIDIAPTALARAKAKAEEAEVEVRWALADVLAPPELEPFDVIFDRGCYHGVRRGNAAGYVGAVRRLSRPGTRVFILAGNATEPEPRRGPPRVKEEEIRSDFSELFEFESLRQTRFDSLDPESEGAWAWAILLRRKGRE